MKQICEFDKCTGCHACLNICPKKCIEMKEDAQGYLYPKVASEKCIDCGLCQKDCPALHPVDLKIPLHVYAAINKTKTDYETATSGGVATLFARKIFGQEGVVYGAAIDKNLEVKHIRVKCPLDIERIKGSKYVQSRIGDSLARTKNDLEDGKKVLFIGTPCQIAGLKKYLKVEYKNLYTCDIVCHGVPSEKLMKDHLKEICDLDSIDTISFRDKDGYYLSLYSGNNQIYHKKNYFDIYCLGFLKGLFLRANCTMCRYAQANRVGDITLGDFWGFDNKQGAFPAQTPNGLSLVMINTQKGQKLFDECTSELIWVERNLEEAVNGNKQLRYPSKQHKNYQQFKKNYLKYGFEKAAKKALWKERIVYAMIDQIRK